MAGGLTIPGYTPPAPGPAGAPPTQDPYTAARASNKVYRPDVGRAMTDEEYTAWKTSNTGGMKGQQTSTNIATEAQKGLEAQKAGFASTQQQAQIDAAQRLQQESEGATSALTTQKADLQGVAEARRQFALQQLMAQLGINSGTIAGGMASGMPGGGGAGGPEDAARAAAFARAKDTAGNIGRSAVTGLQEAGAGRGIGGSGIVGGEIGQAVNAGATQVGEVNREQLIQDLDNARKRASEALSAGVTMRGQNLALIESALGGLTAAY